MWQTCVPAARQLCIPKQNEKKWSKLGNGFWVQLHRHCLCCQIKAYTLGNEWYALYNMQCAIYYKPSCFDGKRFHAFIRWFVRSARLSRLSVFSWSEQIVTPRLMLPLIYTLVERDASRVPFTNSCESQGLFLCSFHLCCGAKCIPLHYHDFH